MIEIDGEEFEDIAIIEIRNKFPSGCYAISKYYGFESVNRQQAILDAFEKIIIDHRRKYHFVSVGKMVYWR